eukprot:6197720-Pleurochrysis_carterae.AAC.4
MSGTKALAGAFTRLARANLPLTHRVSSLPPFFPCDVRCVQVERVELREWAQLPARHRLAAATHRITVLTEGVLNMQTTLLGVIAVGHACTWPNSDAHAAPVERVFAATRATAQHSGSRRYLRYLHANARITRWRVGVLCCLVHRGDRPMDRTTLSPFEDESLHPLTD